VGKVAEQMLVGSPAKAAAAARKIAGEAIVSNWISTSAPSA